MRPPMDYHAVMAIKAWRYRIARLLVGTLRVDEVPAGERHTRCSWCVQHGFRCGGDVHAVANRAMQDVIDQAKGFSHA